MAVLGHRVSTASAPLLPATGGAAATVDDTGARYLVAGRLTGEVELLSGGHVVGHRQFSLRTAQPGPASAPGGAVLALILFAGAYAESFLRALRRGRRKAVGTVGMAVMGGLLGVALVGLTWLGAGREPTMVTVIVDAALGGLAGIAAAIGGMRIGRRRRFRRVQRREKAAG
jgi:serine/threonine-protein kinase